MAIFRMAMVILRPAHAINGIYLSDKAPSVRNTKMVSEVMALE